MASKVFLHVGAPLAPSTVLRDALGRHRRRLARAGVLYPPSHLGYDGGHRDAVLDALGLTAAGDHAPPAAAWDRLAETVRDWRRGTAVISHELLADATEAQVDRVVSSLGSAEVHVVYVVQHLGRQVPRAWQQWVHGGGSIPFASYAHRVLRREDHRVARVFWRSHDVAEVLTRWSTRVPPERVHVVTAGADLPETWERLGETLGIDHRRFRADTATAPPLAPLAGTEVVRLLNAGEVPLDPSHLEAVVRYTHLARGGSPRLPAALREPVAAETERVTDAIAANGWELVGSQADLVPDEDSFGSLQDHATPAEEDVLDAQTAVIRALCTPTGARRGPAGVRRRALRAVRDRVRP